MNASEPKERNPPSPPVDFYDSTYGRFNDALYQQIRRETWHDDFGQNGWITAAEQDRFIEWLALGPGQRLLDIACGSGGPTLRIAQRTRATVVGVDIHPDGIRAARRQSDQAKLADLATFEILDAQGILPFDRGAFDAVVCIDAINHLADRPKVLAEWARVIKPGGWLLFTDPAIVTGPLTNAEIATRSSIGHFLFVAPDTNDRMLSETGFAVKRKEDLSQALAQVAAAWHAARQTRAADLAPIETQATFDGQQSFLRVASRLAGEKRLSRWAYLAQRV